MSVTINLNPTLSSLANNQKVVEVNGSTVGECLDELVKQFPKVKPLLLDKNGKLHNYVEVYVNQESSYPEELDKQVNDGDELHVTMIIFGG
jgi:molybdopterin converting factor small subunit